jgi:hypothetical protein
MHILIIPERIKPVFKMKINWTLMLLMMLTACGERQNGKQSDSLSVAQSVTSLEDTLSGRKDDVLICIDYPGADGNEPSFNLEGMEPLSEEYIRHYLFLGADSVYIENIWSLHTVGRKLLETYLSTNQFYVLDTILQTTLYSGGRY